MDTSELNQLRETIARIRREREAKDALWSAAIEYAEVKGSIDLLKELDAVDLAVRQALDLAK